MKIVISSGHGKLIRGASGYLDEVDEARKVVNEVAEYLAEVGVGVEVFHDDVSTSQQANLERIVGFHNGQTRELDVSVHFNAYQTTPNPMGCECLYVTQETLAKSIAGNICANSGLKNRGPKKRTDLYFLNKTEEPAILIEVCFVDSVADAEIYKARFSDICKAIAEAISGVAISAPPVPEPPPEESTDLLQPLLSIDPVTIYQAFGGRYVAFISDLDICNDGTGPSYGDPNHQPQTAYYNGGKYLNADVDKYIVIPDGLRDLITVAKAMGCQGRLTNLKTGLWNPAVTGEVGPPDKTGEAAYCLAKIVNPQIGHNSGDESRIYLYELWPGIPATVDGRTYKLE